MHPAHYICDKNCDRSSRLSGSGFTIAFGQKKMIGKYLKTVHFDVNCGKERKAIVLTSVEDLATKLQEVTSSAQETCNGMEISRTFDKLVGIVLKILRNVLQSYPFKITYVQKLLPADLQKLRDFDLKFLARMKVDSCMAIPRFVDKQNPFAFSFHFHGSVNTQNYRIWTVQGLVQMQQSPLHSLNFPVWCGFIAVFNLGLIIFGEIGPFRLITCIVNETCYDFFSGISLFHHSNKH